MKSIYLIAAAAAVMISDATIAQQTPQVTMSPPMGSSGASRTVFAPAGPAVREPLRGIGVPRSSRKPKAKATTATTATTAMTVDHAEHKPKD